MSRVTSVSLLVSISLLISARADEGWQYSHDLRNGYQSCVIDVTTGDITGATIYLTSKGDEKRIELLVQTKSAPHESETNLAAYIEVANDIRDLDDAETLYGDGQSNASIVLTGVKWAAFKDVVTSNSKAKKARLVAGERVLEVPLKGLAAAMKSAEKDCSL